MQLKAKTLEKLRMIINGDGTSDYRKGSELVKFFNEFGFQDVYGTGFPSRHVYTDEKLQEINGTPELDKCIKKTFAVENYIGRINELDSLIDDFNQYLAFDKWAVERDNDCITFKKLDRVSIIEKDNDTVDDKEQEFLKRTFEGNEFKMFDSLGGFELRELRNRNIKFNKENRPNLYYPFYINPNEKDENGLHTISLEAHDGWIELYPLESQGINTVWRWGKEKSTKNLNKNIMAKPMRNGSYMIVEKYRESRMMARSVWWDKDTNTEKGTLLVKDMMDGKVFDYPKPDMK